MEVRCKHCGGNRITKKGKAKTHFCEKQVYYCKDCKHKFVDSTLSHKTYPPKVICSAISTYNLGNTLEETVRIINRRFKIKLPKRNNPFSWIEDI